MALSIFEETFGRERNRFSKVSRREATTEHLVAITKAVQAVVDTFRDPNTGDRYVVSMSGRTEAYTQPGTKRIVVSYKPIFDKGLKVSTACTVMTGLTLHEIGHTLYTFPNMPVIEAAYGKPTGQRWGVKDFDQLAYTMLNIGDDARLEARMAEQLPIARDIFPTMLHWVAINTDMVGNRLRWTGKSMRMVDRVNFAARASRYPWTAVWSSDTATREERAWWIDWARQYKALGDRDGEGMVALVDIALARLREPKPVVNVEPPKPEGPVGPTGPDEGEDEGPGGKSKDPFGDDFDKDEDGDESGSDEDEDDDEGDPGDGLGEADDEDEDEDGDEWGDDPDGDEPGPYQPEVEDEDDESESEDGGSKVDVPDDLTDEDSDDGGDSEDSGDEADTDTADGDDVGTEPEDDKPRTFPQDFDAHDLRGDVDRTNRGNDDWRTADEGALLQRAIDVDASTERVATTKWGTAKVEVRSIEQLAAQRGGYRQ